MRHLKSLFLLHVVSLVSLDAQAAEKAIGKVLPKSDRVLLRVGNGLSGDVFSISWPATVKTTDGRWLWVEDDGGSGRSFVGGWVRTDDIVPLNTGLEYFNARLIGDPSSASAYWLRGLCWEQVHEFGLALKDYEEAVRLDGSNRDAKLGLARMLAAHHKYDEKKFHEAWEANASSPRLFVDWGSALEVAGQTKRAQAMYKTAAQLNPTWHMPYYLLGKLAAEEKDYAGALDQYAEALRRNPSFHAVHRGRATAWLASKDITFEELQKILRADDPAQEWLKAHKPDEIAVSALSAAHKACDLTSFRESESLSVLAEAFAAFARWPEARRFQQMAVEYAPFPAKQPHIDRYYAYNTLVTGSTMLAQAETSHLPTVESRVISRDKPSGGRVTESVKPTPEEAGEASVAETLPQPAAKTPRRPLFIDRSALRFQ
jgi:tetratricopeptide (TPR) repeat protein